jgi:uracil phosphoribosyltransferase
MILDPMLATSGTLIATIGMLKKAGCKDIIGNFLIAAPEGSGDWKSLILMSISGGPPLTIA